MGEQRPVLWVNGDGKATGRPPGGKRNFDTTVSLIVEGVWMEDVDAKDHCVSKTIQPSVKEARMLQSRPRCPQM